MQYFDVITRDSFKRDENPLGYSNIRYVSKVNESKGLNDKKGPLILISASGMCENGRILYHLKNNINDRRNMIIAIGFMAKNTLGRRIVEREEIVKIFGHPYNRYAEVVTLNAFSSHADKDGLINYVKSCRETLKRVFIVHGDEDQSEALLENIKKLNIKVSIPSKRKNCFSCRKMMYNVLN